MKRLDKLLDNIYKYMSIVIILAMLCTVTWQIISRQINVKNFWTEELSRWFYVWGSFLSGAYFVRKKEHISVDVFENSSVMKKIKNWSSIPISLLSIAFYVFVVIGGINLVGRFGTSPAIGFEVPLTVLYLSIPVTFSLMCIFEVFNLTQLIRGKERN